MQEQLLYEDEKRAEPTIHKSKYFVPSRSIFISNIRFNFDAIQLRDFLINNGLKVERVSINMIGKKRGTGKALFTNRCDAEDALLKNGHFEFQQRVLYFKRPLSQSRRKNGSITDENDDVEIFEYSISKVDFGVKSTTFDNQTNILHPFIQIEKTISFDTVTYTQNINKQMNLHKWEQYTTICELSWDVYR
ncbi:hypothetical protein RFI_15117 [Reticulomyxa filosa]|uniref:RRM domain-containing protein n=1 Tax=Reticulomyxa filosa TaxID=46433 RepID=X6N835_RETFI|nr:hypothetical protein RFI_15117 [Reticulomyxa filosa]|eukprot:ETO22083.1 hypothetical protein RFI_15117 [Reticulomyxa filosa]